jgi:hypothetical protein
MGRKKIDEVSKPSAGDAGLAVVRSMPVLGDAATELLNFVVTPPLEGRSNDWLNDLASDLGSLTARVDKLKVSVLSDNDDFLSAVAVAVGVATRSAQQEKRDMLRYAVLNAALGHVPNFDMQSVFIGYLDYLSPLHVQLLRVFSDPRAALSQAGSDLENSLYTGGAPSRVVEELFTDLRDRRDVYDFLWQDLYQRRLVNTDSLHGMMSKEGMLASRTTQTGAQFLVFLSEPPEMVEPPATR